MLPHFQEAFLNSVVVGRTLKQHHYRPSLQPNSPPLHPEDEYFICRQSSEMNAAIIVNDADGAFANFSALETTNESQFESIIDSSSHEKNINKLINRILGQKIFIKYEDLVCPYTSKRRRNPTVTNVYLYKSSFAKFASSDRSPFSRVI